MPKTPNLTESVTLPDLGVAVVLRPARLADTYRAMSLVDIPEADAKDGDRVTPAGLAYQLAVDDMQVLCQIVECEGVEPVNLPALSDDLSPDDMAALREAAAKIKKKRNALKTTGANGASSNALSSSADGGSTKSETPS